MLCCAVLCCAIWSLPKVGLSLRCHFLAKACDLKLDRSPEPQRGCRDEGTPLDQSWSSSEHCRVREHNGAGRPRAAAWSVSCEPARMRSSDWELPTCPCCLPRRHGAHRSLAACLTEKEGKNALLACACQAPAKRRGSGGAGAAAVAAPPRSRPRLPPVAASSVRGAPLNCISTLTAEPLALLWAPACLRAAGLPGAGGPRGDAPAPLRHPGHCVQSPAN